MRVLVIDDGPDIVEIVRATLRQRWPEIEVLRVPDDDAGVRAATRSDPHLVMVCVTRASGAGFDACGRIRRESEVPIILLSERGEEADAVRGLELGADDYIVRPFAAEELLARVHAVLRRS